MITWNDMHRYAKGLQWLNEHLTVAFQHLVVHILTMIEIITQMKDGLDVILFAIWKEYLTVKLLHVVKEDIASIVHTTVCIV
tara:strand:- start:3214 stop:3459 length:246 start_codon:yes stop_codon:yes gene_type:complete